MQKTNHIPVLLKEVVTILNPKKFNLYIDATFGTGGYTKSILNKSLCNVLALDCDQNTIRYANEIKKIYFKRFNFTNKNFKDIELVLSKLNISKINGIVFDLGVSSIQLNSKNRGFSFNKNALLDMRMDIKLPLNAIHYINTMHEKELSNLIYNFGGEKKSRFIAKNIIEFRKKNIEFVYELVDAINAKKYKDKIHFATRTFQAFRIAVNNELQNLKTILKKIPLLLSKNGIIAIVTFHSLEDKIVKYYFNKYLLKKNFKKTSKKIIIPTLSEIKRNPRAKSAKLRIIKKLNQ